ncbi:MAG: hypothetical protein ING09_15305 [Roseomonas sp.]|nr:hypothetical protein [Roseomonas sp.]MCA3287913.1 hypothetical protein [Roseomonas sp.]MCA3292635.1 hypothetical protein [Roseomonas sp.]MCA3296030.1 hypothetical protein [Roseomonas sp.]MCA4920231.1 hypothetical protein [Roseomonas sp.]
MPFIATSLSALSAANGFTLWHYRTTDNRAETGVAGYFTPAADRVRIGDIILVQASDGTTMLPVRAGNLTGAAVVLDSLGAPPEIQRSAYLPFSISLTGTTEARAITIDPMPNAIEPGASVPVGATILGNITNITFQIRNAAGTVLATQASAVANGRASVLFPAQASGGGYRILARNTADTNHFSLSAPFAIGMAPRLLNEEGGVVLLEDSGQLLLF